MRIKVSPLVVAAALGLLGPAALADDDETPEEGLAGIWQRTNAGPSSPLPLGDRIEVIPFEGTVLLDDGTDAPRGDWTMDGDRLASQQLRVDGQRVTRRFAADGDRLDVHTTVCGGGDCVEFVDTFIRHS